MRTVRITLMLGAIICMTENSEPLEFKIYANDGFVKIHLATVYGYPNETCHWGGYDTQSQLEIKSQGLTVLTNLYISTGELYNFYEQLSKAYDSLTGTANLTSYEGNLNIVITFDNLGHANIEGKYREYIEPSYSVEFEMSTDQSYLKETVEELERIYQKYGNNTGISGLKPNP